MPSKNKHQHQFMLMSASPKGRARLRAYGSKPAPMSVAKEFIRADKQAGKFKGKKKRKKR